MPENSQEIIKKTTAQTIFEDLRSQIISGQLPAGSLLPSERNMVESYNNSRGAIREAVQRLGQARLITIQHGGRTRINDYRKTAGLDLLTSLIKQNDVVDVNAIRSLIEMRTALAIDAARLAALRSGKGFGEALIEKTQQLKESNDDNRLEIVLEYWDLVVEGSNNIAYQLSINSLRDVYDIYQHVFKVLVNADFHFASYNKLTRSILNAEDKLARNAAKKLVERDAEQLGELLDVFEKAANRFKR